jgi:hypothetical protein
VTKPKHVGTDIHSPKEKRVSELLSVYTERITIDFLAVRAAKERYDDLKSLASLSVYLVWPRVLAESAESIESAESHSG